MRNILFLLLLAISLTIILVPKVNAQTSEGEKIVYYQMEPLDDSLFIKIQSELFIEPPDPKAEIIVDLRDPNNQTISVKGVLYPFLALKPETRAKVITYPFKVNLEENINYGSVFTRVITKLNLGKIVSPPSLYQISSTLGYINPFLQLFGGEPFGVPIRSDLGLSFGMGTPYSGPFETNFVQADIHLLGFYGGVYQNVDALTQYKKENNQNNLYATSGYVFGYVVPFGNFFEFSYLKSTEDFTQSQLKTIYDADTLGMVPKLIDASYFNWELRYPIRILGSTRAKFYVSNYLNEVHIGFTGRELSLSGNTFDFSFDGMVHSDVRQPEYVINVLVQRIFDDWAFSALAIGPSLILSKRSSGSFGVISLFFNLRLKVGTSL
jgi:hypothetical protein